MGLWVRLGVGLVDCRFFLGFGGLTVLGFVAGLWAVGVGF